MGGPSAMIWTGKDVEETGRGQIKARTHRTRYSTATVRVVKCYVLSIVTEGKLRRAHGLISRHALRHPVLESRVSNCFQYLLHNPLSLPHIVLFLVSETIKTDATPDQKLQI